MTDHIDKKYMKKAISLARKGDGHTSPNPMVGALLVKNGNIIGKGYHKKAGLPHAEIEAFKDARKKKKSISGATLYVTLEPCCHTNKRTPPCTDAIIREKIKKVCIATLDPNPEVSGDGVKTLRKNGIEVEVGCMGEEAFRMNEYFNKYIVQKIPFVVLKMAATLDGKIASFTGSSKWIGSEDQRKNAHIQRSKVDAVLVGINTALNDDPSLNVRLKGRKISQPVPVILDSNLKLSTDAKVFKVSESVIIATNSKNKAKTKSLQDAGAKVIRVRKNKDGNLSFPGLLRRLGKMGISSILIEGGSKVAASALSSKVVDKVVFFFSPRLMGGDGISMIAPLGKKNIKNAINLTQVSYTKFGNEIMVEGYISA